MRTVIDAETHTQGPPKVCTRELYQPCQQETFLFHLQLKGAEMNKTEFQEQIRTRRNVLDAPKRQKESQFLIASSLRLLLLLFLAENTHHKHPGTSQQDTTYTHTHTHKESEMGEEEICPSASGGNSKVVSQDREIEIDVAESGAARTTAASVCCCVSRCVSD